MKIPSLSLLCLASAATIYAQTETNLPPVVVTASRLPEPQHRASASIESVSAQQLNETQRRTLPEALTDISGVLVQKTSYGQGSPFIRGFTGFRTLMLVDGIRLNSPVFRDGPNQYWNTVDSFYLGSLELLKGAGSALYGSDAIGGTAQAFTLLPEYASTEGADIWGGRLAARAASAERSLIGRSEAYYGSTGWAGLFGVTAKRFGDLDGGRHVGRQRKTGYRELDYDAKVRIALRGDREIIFAHMAVDQNDVWRTHRTPYGISWNGTAIGTEPVHRFDQDHTLTYLRFIDREATFFYDTLQLTLYRQRQDEWHEVVKKDLTRTVDGFDVRTWGLMADMVKESAYGTWAYGAEYLRDGIDSFRRNYRATGVLKSIGIQGPVADDSIYHTVALYVQDQLWLDKHWELTAGLRGTYVRADIGRYENFATTPHTPASLTEDWADLSGQLRLAYHIEDQWQAYGSLSRSFRAPGLSDLTSFNVNRSTDVAIPSPDLDPEHYWSGEVGTRATLGPAQWQLAYFYTRVSGKVVGHLLPNGYTTKYNGSDGYVHGIETDLQLALGRNMRFKLGAAWIEGRNDYKTPEGDKVSEPMRTAPLSMFAGLRWESSDKRFWAETTIRAVDREDRLTDSDRRDTQRIPPNGTPGYAMADIRCGWRLSESASLVAGVENITDKDYRIHGSGSNEPGRNFILSADYRF